MTSTLLKIALTSLLSLSFAAPTLAASNQTTTAIQSISTHGTYIAESDRMQAATLCAMELTPKAQSIFHAVSPKVTSDSNLKKLVKKHVRPKVFSGKLSIKSARQHAQDASACLRVLKHGSSAEQ